MILTTQQRICLLIGDFSLQIAALQTENEQLKAQLAEKEPKAPTPEPTPSQDQG